jgi:hypothetical protein
MRPVHKCAKSMTTIRTETAFKVDDQDYRCPACGRLLFRGRVIQVETRCPRCKRLVDCRGGG